MDADIVINGHGTLQNPTLAIFYVVEANKPNEPHLHNVYVKFYSWQGGFCSTPYSVVKLPIPEGLSRWWDALRLWGMSQNLTLTVISPEVISPETENTIRACLHGGEGPHIDEIKCDGSPHLLCKRDHFKMRDYIERRVTPPKRVRPAHLPGVPLLRLNRPPVEIST